MLSRHRILLGGYQRQRKLSPRSDALQREIGTTVLGTLIMTAAGRCMQRQERWTAVRYTQDPGLPVAAKQAARRLRGTVTLICQVRHSAQTHAARSGWDYEGYSGHPVEVKANYR